jgi:hypothetical protein
MKKAAKYVERSEGFVDCIKHRLPEIHGISSRISGSSSSQPTQPKYLSHWTPIFEAEAEVLHYNSAV